MIHTPHRDKKRGTLRSMDVLEEHGFDPARCVIDHNNEETVREVLDRGFWAGFSIYPQTKMGNERMVEIVRQYGAGAASSSIPPATGASPIRWRCRRPRALMAERGIGADVIRQVTYDNALAAYGQSGEMKEARLARPAADRPAHAVRGQQRAARRPRRRGSRSRDGL